MNQRLIVPLAKVRIKRADGKLVLFIDGKRKQGPHQRTLKLLECLLAHRGRIVPYELISWVMDRSTHDDRSLHVLRQYILALKTLFRKERIAAYIAVAETVGYGLCELAKW